MGIYADSDSNNKDFISIIQENAKEQIIVNAGAINEIITEIDRDI